jgi:pimeloyl-ACP methyl ester carboxylesterase
MRLNVIEAGQGPPLVLLHGLFGSARNWGAVQKALATDYRVVALDLRNHGASPHAPDMDYAAQAADVAETLAALGIKRAVVLGHSMGGKAAMMLALTRPELIERLIIADIAPRPYAPALRAVVAAMQALPLHAGLTRQEADQALRVTGGSDPRSYVVINLVTGTPLNYVGQSYAMTSRRIQINLYATTPLVARAMMDACIAALESYGVILFENPSFYDGATKLYSRSLDFSIHQPR